MLKEEFVKNKECLIQNQIDKYAKYKIVNYENIINLCYEKAIANNQILSFELSVRKILEKKIIYEIKKGNKELRNYFILDNLNLIKKAISSIAIHYTFDMDDLLNTGVLAFIYAIEHYDIESNNMFSTFSYKTIKLYVLEYTNDKANIIKIDNNIKYKIKKLNSSKKNNISESNALKYKKYEYMYNVMSFNEMIKTIINEEKEIGNIVKADYNLEQVVEINEAYNIFLDSLNKIPMRNATIVRQYLGIGYNVKSAIELSKQYNITHQRVNCIINKVLNDIVNSEDGEKIKQLLK